MKLRKTHHCQIDYFIHLRPLLSDEVFYFFLVNLFFAQLYHKLGMHGLFLGMHFLGLGHELLFDSIELLSLRIGQIKGLGNIVDHKLRFAVMRVGTAAGENQSP